MAFSPSAHALTDDCEPPLKRIRKGTKSCVECRQRKIKCIWQDESDAVCRGCQQRGRDCVPQLYTRRSTQADHNLTSKDRISRLEQQIANIAATVTNRPHGDSASLSLSPQDDYGHGAETPRSPSVDQFSDPDHTQGPADAPPAHLKFLFDNPLIGPDVRGADSTQGRPHCSKRYADNARAKLQRLLPTAEDVAAVSSYAPPWMNLYYQLFPSSSSSASRDQLVANQDDVEKGDADILLIATFLLTFAITVRQAPEEVSLTVLGRISKGVQGYVQEVLHTIDNTIVSHTGIASTADGIAVSILFLRLQLGMGAIKTVWLTLRRTIALAELIGLPRARYNQSTRSPDRALHLGEGTDKIALWESVCATDRLASMMFNLPAATASHRFPRKQIVSDGGIVLLQPYMFELATIAMRVQDLDEAYATGSAHTDVYETVLLIDQDLRALKRLTPISWWREESEYLSAELLLQYWHSYLLTRIHLHAAMAEDDHQTYAYSRATCLEACHILSRRYASMRRALPPGFFVSRIIDMQIFTAATFLLLSSYRQTSKLQIRQGHDPTVQPDQHLLTSVERIVSTMEFVQKQAGAEFARDAASALRALSAHFQNPSSTHLSHPQGLTLRIPLLGKVHIGRKGEDEYPHPAQLPPGAVPSIPTSSSAAPDANGDYAIPRDLPSSSVRNLPLPTTTPTQWGGGMSTAVPDAATGTGTGATAMMPWYLELDTNMSGLQDPFLMMEDFGDLDQWSNNVNVPGLMSGGVF